MEEIHGAKYGGRAEIYAFFESATLPKSPCVHQPGSSPNPVFWGFYGDFIIYVVD